MLYNDSNISIINVVKCNLYVVDNKESLRSFEGLRNCFTHASVQSPRSTFIRAKQCFVRHLH